MDTYSVVIMRKDSNNILSEEVAVFDPKEKAVYIDSVFSTLKGGKDLVHLRISTDRDVEEWEFSAIFDYYDTDKIKGFSFVEAVGEKDDSYNPMWEIEFFLPSNEDVLSECIDDILKVHSMELEEVYEEIKDKRDEY